MRARARACLSVRAHVGASASVCVCVTVSAMKALDTSHFSQLQSKRTDQIHFFHRFCDDTETSTPKSDFC